MKHSIKDLRLLALYAVSIITSPIGTEYKRNGQKINRFSYTYKTCASIWNIQPF